MFTHEKPKHDISEIDPISLRDQLAEWVLPPTICPFCGSRCFRCIDDGMIFITCPDCDFDDSICIIDEEEVGPTVSF